MSRPATFSGRRASQKTKELNRMLEVFQQRGVKTYLEIGARNGDTFFEVCTRVPSVVMACAVDLPGGAWGHASTQRDLEKVVGFLKDHNTEHAYEMILGNSQDPETFKKIIDFCGSYDAILIDGDHRFAGVLADWGLYHPIADGLVVFHDIAGMGVRQKSNPELLVEVPEFWNGLKRDAGHLFSFEEIISDEEPENPMGIGIVYKEKLDVQITAA